MDTIYLLLLYLIPVVLVAIAYFIGSWIEARHYRSIRLRERQWLTLPIVSFDDADGQFPTQHGYTGARVVQGAVVISVDRFKQMLAGLRNIFGGRVAAYETLLDRGRREALLRMKEAAGDASIIVNVRVETSTLGGHSQGSLGTVEVHAYGTALEQHETPPATS